MHHSPPHQASSQRSPAWLCLPPLPGQALPHAAPPGLPSQLQQPRQLLGAAQWARCLQHMWDETQTRSDRPRRHNLCMDCFSSQAAPKRTFTSLVLMSVR